MLSVSLVGIAYRYRSTPKIDVCRLVVNVFKHGKGNSLDALAQRYPQYLGDNLPQYEFMKSHLDHEALTIAQNDLDDFAGAIRAFWSEFPERLYLQISAES